MPTPFTHLEVAQRLLADERVPEAYRALLHAERGAFLLGSVAADARISADLTRESTHFYAYNKPIVETPWRVMLTQHPSLCQPHSPAQIAFLAGYVGHLSIDECWQNEVVKPRFVVHEWETSFDNRFLMLHIILIYMDERDLRKLKDWQSGNLFQAQPDAWLPFMNDTILREWRDYIAEQIAPGGESLTLNVFGNRIGVLPEKFRSILDSPEEMQNNLWKNVPRDYLARAEVKMYAHARQQLCVYMETYSG